MDKDRALRLLQEALSEVPRLKSLPRQNEEHELWQYKVKDILRATFSESSDEYVRFARAVSSVMTHGTEKEFQEEYVIHLTAREVALKSVIQNIEILGVSPQMIASPALRVSEPPSVFIAHGGHSQERDGLELFLWRAGYRPIIVEELVSRGKSPDEKVDYYMGKCQFSVIFAEINRAAVQDGKLYPRLNIIDEMARIRKILDNKFIVLLERGLTLNSDQQVTWEPFDKDNIAKAYLAVLRELKAHGIQGSDELEAYA